MGRDSVEIRVVMRKISINSVRLLYRSACKHPFIVGLLCFLLFLYKSFPFLLYLLVTTSPVLVCTAVLLGTLLSFGQPNIPEIEEEEEEEVVTCHEIDSLKAGVAHDATVVERDVSFGAERFVGLEGDVIEKEEEEGSEIAPLEAGVVHDRDAIVVERDVSFGTERFVGLEGDVIQETVEHASSVETEVGRNVDVFGSVVDNVLVVDGKAREDQYEKGGVDEEDERDLDDLELEEERRIHKEKSRELETEGVAIDGEGTEDRYSLIGKERDEDHDGGEIENQYTLVGEGRDEDHDREELENQYTLVGQGEDESLYGEEIENRSSLIGEERGDNLEVGIDRLLGELVGSHTRRPVDSEEEEEEEYDESSDEESDGAESSSPDASLADIIPMLDELHPLLHEGATRPMPHDDSDGTSERSSSSHGHIVESDEDSEDDGKQEEKVDGDDEDEESSPGEKGHASTSPMAWTEDDQKNVMDLGTSEIERNRRLESLIARRHARKAISTTKHKDLIDFDSDLHFSVPHITTTRRNPFDGPDDSYADMGLPPIPGSAPSILVPRRNPFDIPYDSSEEKPDLKGDSFEEEFAGFQQKESTVFSRHASFSWRPSKLGGPRKEKQDFSRRPFFGPEGSLPSEGSSYSSLLHRQLSEISDAKTSSVPDTESVSSAIDEDDMKLSERDLSQGRELMPFTDHASDHVSRESQSSDDEHSVGIEEIVQREGDHDEAGVSTRDLQIHPTTETGDAMHIEEIVQRDADHDEVEISTRDLQIHLTTETGYAATPMKLGTGEVHLKPAADEDDYSRWSSTELSKVSEVVSDVNREGTVELEAKGILTEESGTSEHPSLEEPELKNMTEVLDDVQQQKEPVYDSIPSPIEKLLSFTSISSEIAYHPAPEEAIAQFTDKESEMQIENRAIDIPNIEAICAASSLAHEVDENVSRPREVVEVSDHDDGKCGPTEAEKESDNSNELDQPALSNLDAEVAGNPNVDENNSEACSHQTHSEDITSTSHENKLPSVMIEHFSVVHPHLLFSEAEPVEETAIPVELGIGEVHLKPAAVEDDYGSGSSTPLSKVSEVVADVNREGTIELEAKGILTEESGISEHPSLEGSEFKNMTEALDDDGEQQEPVYVSNPSPIENYFLYQPSPTEKLLTFSSISSEEAIAQFTDKEFEMQIENRAMDIPSDEVICAASLQIHEVDENVSRSKGAVEVSDYDDGKSGSAEAEKDHDNPNELDQLASSNSDTEVHVAVNQNVEDDNSEASSHQIPSEDLTSTSQERSLPSVVVEHVSVLHPHLSFSETEPVEEPAVDEIDTHHSGQGQIYTPRLDEEVHQDVQEKFDPLTVEQVQMVHPSSSESDHAEEYMLSKEETPEFEEKEVHSSSYDANVSTDVHPDLDVEVVSQHSYEEAPSEENSPSESEKWPSWSDKSMVEPTFDEHHGLQEPSFVQTDVMDAEESAVVPEFHDSKDKVSPSTGSTLNTSQTSEYEPSLGGEAFKKDDEDRVQASELEINKSVPYETHIPEANINMEEDYIKEIDEGLLSELDRVGDFYTEEVKSLHTEMIQEGTEDNELNLGEANLELPAFEARSVEDIEMAFKQLHEGVDIEEVILPSSFQEEPDMEYSVETISNFQVINARSVDEIHVALKEAFDGILGKSSEPLELKDGSAADNVSSTEKIDSDRVEPDVEKTSMGTLVEPVDGLDEASDISNFHVINTRSVEDIQVALNEVSDDDMGKSDEPLIFKDELAEVEADKVSSTKDLDSAKVEPEVEGTSIATVVEPVDVLDEASDNPNFHFTSARSVDGIQVVVKEVSDGNLEKSAEPLDFKDGSAEFEVEKVSSTKDLDSAGVEPDVEETSMTIHDTSIDGVDKASDNSNFKVSETRSVDDIQVVVKEVSDDNLKKSAEPVDFKDGSADVEVAKVSSTEDLYSARVEFDGEETSTAALAKSVVGVDIRSDHSNFQAIDARYLEDIQVALTEVSDGNLGKSPEKLDSKHVSAEFEGEKVSSTEDPDSARVEPDVEETSMAVHDTSVAGLDEASENSKFRVIDARSLEPVNVALEEDFVGNLGKSPEKLDSKDESAEFEVEKVSSSGDLDSARAEPDIEETSAAVVESFDNSNFQVIDARGLEDIHVALEEVSDGNLGKSPKKLDSKDESAEFENEKVSSTEDLYSVGVEPDVEETSMAVHDKSVDRVDEAFDNSNFQVIDARSIDDNHVALEEVSDGNVGKSPDKLESKDDSVEFEVEKVSSAEDLDFAGVEPGVEETSMAVHDKSVNELDEASAKSDFEVIDASSLEDIVVAIEKGSDGNLGESPELSGSEDGLAEFEVEKVSSAEDLDFAGVEPGVEETSMAVHDKSVNELDKTSAKSNFEVIGASSPEHIHVALEKVSDGNLGESPELLDSEDGSAEFEVNKASFTENLHSVRVEPDVEETSMVVLDKPVDGLDEASDNSNFQVIDTKSVDDIQVVAAKEVSDGNPAEALDFKDGKAEVKVAKVEPDVEETSMAVLDKLVDGVDETSDVSNFQVLDTCSADDIHVALKEVSDGEVGKSQEPFDSKDEQIEAKDEDVGSTADLDSTNMISPDKPLDGLDETPESSTFQVTDARSMKDTHVALKEVSDSIMGKSPEPLDSKDGSVQIEVEKVSSIEDLDSASMVALDKPIDGVDEACESSKFETRR